MFRSPDGMRRKGKGPLVYFTVAVIVSCYLAQTIDCLRLKKTERREGRKELDAAKTTAFQEGRILFGRTFEKGFGLESKDIDGTKKSNDSSEDDSAYQADHAGASKAPVKDFSSKEALWNHMTPSLQCGGDQLKFKAVGPGVTHFKVEQENAPVSLSQVPPSCGYTMQRNPFALVMQVPYDGCNMVQEGGYYRLPMRWQGVPVSLLCPKLQSPPAPQMVVYPQSYPQMPVHQHSAKAPDMSHHKVPHSSYYPQHPQQFPSYHHHHHQQFPSYHHHHQQFPSYHHHHQQFPVYYQHQQFPSHHHQPHQHQKYPFHHHHHHPHQPYPYFPAPTKAPTTSQRPVHPLYPYSYYPYYYPSYHWPQGGTHQTTTTTTTRPTTTTTTTPPPTTTTQTTTTKSTTEAPAPNFPPYMPYFPPYPPFPPFFPPFPPFPTTKPTTTAKQTTTTAKQTTTTAKPTTTTAKPTTTTAKPTTTTKASAQTTSESQSPPMNRRFAFMPFPPNFPPPPFFPPPMFQP